MAARRLTRAQAGLAALTLGLLIAAAFLGPAEAAKKPPTSDYYGLSLAEPISDADWERMKAAHIHSVRAPFLWPILQEEPRRGRRIEKVIEWERVDPTILAGARNGVRMLPYVYGTPDFLAKKITEPPLSRKLRREWTMLLQALQDRYGPRGRLWAQNPDVPPAPITAWQIWNEPNSKAYWRNPRTAPEQYAKLLEISSKALNGGGGKRARRSGGAAKIVAAGLFATPTRGMPMHKFLRRLFDTQRAKLIDTLALHPYGPTLNGVKRQLQLARYEMKQGGRRGTPLWITEIGWPSDGHPQNPYYKTPKQQAKILADAFDLFRERRWGINRVYWYTWRDNNVNPACDVCRFSGLLEADGDPKPAWYRYVRYSGGSPGD